VSTRVEELRELLAPVVEALGYELWGVEMNVHGRHALLRIYIDREAGITVDDCALVSQHASGTLDVADPIAGAYTLEVSSPGWDRPLFTPEQYRAYIGERVKLKLAYPVQGQRNCTGQLLAVDAAGVEIGISEEARLTVPFAAIKRAHLVIESE
jgi:ribosome maturation factor RimP